MRRLSRLLTGGVLGFLAGLGAAQLGGLHGADFYAPPLILAPVGILLVLLFQLAREGAAWPGCYTAVLGGITSLAFAQSWLEPLGVISREALVTYVWVFAAWGALLAAPLVLVLPSSTLGLLMLALMLTSGSILVAALAVLILVYTAVRAWARWGRVD